MEGVFRNSSGVLFAVGSMAPLFRRATNLWAAYSLGSRGQCSVSPGHLPIISVGRHIYELANQGWQRIASARGKITLLWASTTKRFYVQLNNGQNNSQLAVGGRNGAWRSLPLTLADDDQIRLLVGIPGKHAVAISEKNLVYALGPKKPRRIALGPELRGLTIHSAAAIGGRLLLAGQVGAAPTARSVLAEIGPTQVTLAEELWPLEADDYFAVLLLDASKRLLVASHHGQLRVQEVDGSWRNGKLEIDEPPPPIDISGRGPARAR